MQCKAKYAMHLSLPSYLVSNTSVVAPHLFHPMGWRLKDKITDCHNQVNRGSPCMSGQPQTCQIKDKPLPCTNGAQGRRNYQQWETISGQPKPAKSRTSHCLARMGRKDEGTTNNQTPLSGQPQTCQVKDKPSRMGRKDEGITNNGRPCLGSQNLIS